jgi:hypothetical protein
MSISLSLFNLLVIHKKICKELEMQDLGYKTTNQIAHLGYLL